MFCHGELSRMKAACGPFNFFLPSAFVQAELPGPSLSGFLLRIFLSGIYEFPVTLCFTAGLALIVFWDEGWMASALWATVAIAHGRCPICKYTEL